MICDEPDAHTQKFATPFAWWTFIQSCVYFVRERHFRLRLRKSREENCPISSPLFLLVWVSFSILGLLTISPHIDHNHVRHYMRIHSFTTLQTLSGHHTRESYNRIIHNLICKISSFSLNLNTGRKSNQLDLSFSHFHCSNTAHELYCSLPLRALAECEHARIRITMP